MKSLNLVKYLFLAIGAATLFTLFFMNEDAAAGIMLTWAYILLGLTVVVTLLMPLINLAKNPKGAVRSLVGLAIVVVVLGVCYAMSSDAPIVNSAGGYFDNPAELKLSDTGLYAAYFAMAATILVVIYGEIRNSFK